MLSGGRSHASDAIAVPVGGLRNSSRCFTLDLVGERVQETNTHTHTHREMNARTTFNPMKQM